MEEHWNSIPCADLGYNDPWKLTLDKLDLLGDIVDERPITRANSLVSVAVGTGAASAGAERAEHVAH